MRHRHGSAAWAVGTLRRHGMPFEEIRAVVVADDPEIVRRYLELHRERLEERAEEQRRTLASLERVLTDSIVGRRGTEDQRARGRRVPIARCLRGRWSARPSSGDGSMSRS